MDKIQPSFLRKSLQDMTPTEWESICDGCGLCCQIQLEDEENGELTLTNSACSYLCLSTHQCTDYPNRSANVPTCISITPDNIDSLYFMPPTCAYRLVAAGYPLPPWHHLISGDKETVHQIGPSMRGALHHDNV